MNEIHDNEPDVILVDDEDRPVGTEQRMKAHQGDGRLHRAFSVFIFNPAGELLLQRRAPNKPLFAGLWSNTCCSHPLPGEETAAAAHRRLREEFGFDTDLEEVFAFSYRATDRRSGLVEREFDHVFVGAWDGTPLPNPDEIDDWRWMVPEALRREMANTPAAFSPWLYLCLERGILSRSPRSHT